MLAKGICLIDSSKGVYEQDDNSVHVLQDGKVIRRPKEPMFQSRGSPRRDYSGRLTCKLSQKS